MSGKYVQISINGIDQGCVPVELGENLPAHCHGLPGIWYACDAYYSMFEAWGFDAGMFNRDETMAAQVEEYVFYHLNEGGEESATHEFKPGSSDFFGSQAITSISWQLMDESAVERFYSTPAPRRSIRGINQRARQKRRIFAARWPRVAVEMQLSAYILLCRMARKEEV